MTIFFQWGKYIIKAPIWSGKSFLFFDGPVFALYKQWTRPMLHRKAKQWFIHLVFEHESNYRLIERNIKPTKSGGDSVVSRLYQVYPQGISSLERWWDHEIIQKNKDIKEQLHDFLEEISFTNQRELEKNLTDLLPPKEVLLSVNFLLQDADNVFEMTPYERVNVFKHLFWLIWIDHAKEKIRDRRREVQTMIKVKSDTTRIHDKFQFFIKQIIAYKKSLLEQSLSLSDIIWLLEEWFQQDFFRDLSLLEENIHIDHFQVDVDRTFFLKTQEIITQSILQMSMVKGKIVEGEKQKKHLEYEKNMQIQEKTKKEKERVHIQNQIWKIDNAWFQALKEKKEYLEKLQRDIEHKIPDHIWELLWEEVDTLADAVRFIESLLAEWKQLKIEQEKLTMQQKNTIQQWKEKEQRKSHLEKQLKILEKEYNKQTQFHCEKIAWNCPYIEMIKWSSMEVLAHQKEQIEQQLSLLNQDKDHESVPWLQKEQMILEQKIKHIRDLLQSLHRQDIQTYYQQRKELASQIKTFSQQLSEYEAKQKQWEQWHQQISRLDGEIKMIEQQIQQKEEQIVVLWDKLMQYEKEHIWWDIALLKYIDKQIIDLLNVLEQLTELIKEYKHTQQEILSLKDEETRLKNLYTIFSQELLLVVLQDFLPTLEEVMNTYLAQMVWYEVRFHLPVASWEKIELHIHIVDEKWERTVKSLSGGQRSVLKLAWILSVSIIMKWKFLFLDETITSLDAETISKVANVLEEFVKQQAMKFYVVTHSSQIQEMTIRDSIIAVNELEGK